MVQIIRSHERYHFETDWLSTYWHFSFDHYRDPKNVHFGPLRVFNDDVIRPGGGFPMHPHREMEIVTYVIEGRLEHRDSMGNVGQIGPGEVQRMSAGTGVRHSEYNASETEPVRLVQLWVIPAVEGLEPTWEQRQFTPEERRGRLLPVAVPAGTAAANGAVRIHQDATIFAARLEPGQSAAHSIAAGRRAYLFVISGAVEMNGERLEAGDQARVTETAELRLAAPRDAATPAELLLLDLP
jgi:redox-sensitive bicupin YhaK (pirin superfamily)